VRLLAAASLVAAALTTTSCGLGNCGDFALSLASDTGGQSSPVAAAKWFAVHGGVAGVPRSGWQETGRDGNGATVTTGGATLHAAQGPDGTWRIDSGSC
jgi:hypothetical protein